MPCDTSLEFRRCQGDFDVCKHCRLTYMEADDCSNCFRDSIARVLQHSWWKEHPALEFMGVHIGQAVSHSLRGFIMDQWRKDREAESASSVEV